jgi:tetratricopeptide (TPR) repeat protein
MNKALDIDIGFTDAHRELGRAHLTAGRYDLALHHLQIANAQIPGDPGTVEGLGRARDMIYQQHRSEVEGMRRTADEHPDDVDAEVALLRVLRELDLMPEALDRLRRCEPSFGGQFDWELEYILALQYASMTDDAIRRSESLVVMYPNEVAPKALLGGMLMSRASEGDLDRAWRLIEDGTRIAPNQRDVLILRALLLGLRGELDASSVLLKRILAALPPDDPDRPMLEEKLRTLGE